MTQSARNLKADDKYIAVDDITLCYHEEGKGEPLFLLHGGITDHVPYMDLIHALAKHIRVPAPDTRAHARQVHRL